MPSTAASSSTLCLGGLGRTPAPSMKAWMRAAGVSREGHGNRHSPQLPQAGQLRVHPPCPAPLECTGALLRWCPCKVNTSPHLDFSQGPVREKDTVSLELTTTWERSHTRLSQEQPRDLPFKRWLGPERSAGGAHSSPMERREF